MARWIRTTGTNSWADLHRGGDDGRGGVRFDLSPAPTVSAMAGSLGGTARWRIEDDDEPETPMTDDRGKPAYRIPLLEEIRQVPRNGLRFMSTFSGCGGSCLGFEWAGYTPLLAVEFVPSAVESYKANHPGVPVYDQDIRELTAEAALEMMGVKAGELDVLEGSPPCESFSTAGRLASGWGETRDYSDGKKQVMDDLFFEFTRLLGGIQPRAFVAENVAGLVRGVSKGYYKRIHAELIAQGYKVEARMLDAQWLGVPQRRARVIFVGVRLDVDAAPAFPDPLPYRYSIRDALAGISSVASVSSRDGHEYTRQEIDPDGPSVTILRAGAGVQRFEVVDQQIERIVYENGGTGGAAQTGREEEDLDAPARTITNSNGADGHFRVERGEVVSLVGGWPRREMSVDEPSATICKDGFSAGDHFVERAPVPDAENDRGDVLRLHHPNRGYFRKNGPDYVVDADEPAPTITKGGIREYEVERAPRDDVQDGQPLTHDYPGRWEQLGPGEADAEHHDLVRSDPDAPVPTITRVGGASNRSSATHPDDPRKFSIPELRRLCGFPDDFDLKGSYSQQWERLGNSVPPPMMFHVAAALRDRVLIPTAGKRRARRRAAG